MGCPRDMLHALYSHSTVTERMELLATWAYDPNLHNLPMSLGALQHKVRALYEEGNEKEHHTEMTLKWLVMRTQYLTSLMMQTQTGRVQRF